MKYFDAHTHLNIQFDEDWKEVGKRTIEAGISFVNVGADVERSVLAVEQVRELGDGCWATVGIHPTEGSEDFEKIRELAKDEKVVAIGECGLEYYQMQSAKSKSAEEKERQKKLFKQHIELALEVGKPLMIHCRASEKSTPASAQGSGEARDAYDDCYEILKEYKDKFGDKLQFDMHFFTSDWANAQKFLDLGGYLSFPGVITFSSACDETIKNMPLDRIMAETDAPFATPVPRRGSRNEPAYVSYVAERIAELRSEPKEVVLRALVGNARSFYRV